MGMNKDQLIKYALMAVGAWLVWKYVVEPAMNKTAIGTPVGNKPAGQVTAGAGAGAGTGAGTNTVTNPFTPTPVAQSAPVSSPLISVAQNPNPVSYAPSNFGENLEQLQYTAATPVGRLRQAVGGGNPSLTPDQWNFYYGKVTGEPQPYDLFVGDRNATITADIYLDRRDAAGIETHAVPVGYKNVNGTFTKLTGLAGFVNMVDNPDVHSPWLT